MSRQQSKIFGNKALILSNQLHGKQSSSAETSHDSGNKVDGVKCARQAPLTFSLPRLIL